MLYETVIGLETHVELTTRSKLFCSCSAEFGADANENVCPACAGMPGMPAVLNKRAIELGIAAAILTNSEISPVITFDKKNYFYPDLPAGYQITQWFAPICKNGRVEIEVRDQSSGSKATGQNPMRKTITLKQIHIEEDAGKLIHDPYSRSSLIDFNRTSVPLAEVVTNPDFRSAAEVVAYLEKLRSLFSFARISDCKMQEGSMRCDVNLSVREQGSEVLGTRTEIKNMNSLKAIVRAIEYETRRHIEALEAGSGELTQETRRWDDDLGESLPMREKEAAGDYRYFPDPEIMPVHIGEEWVESVRRSLPEPAHERYRRMTAELGLPEAESRIITGSLNLSSIFEETLKHSAGHRDALNWIVGDLLSVAKSFGVPDDEISIDGEKLARVIKMVADNSVNRQTGKKILAAVFEKDVDPDTYVSENKLGMVSDEGYLESVIRDVLAENPKTVAEYRGGAQKVFGFLVGQTMKRTAGKADPRSINDLLAKMLDELH